MTTPHRARLLWPDATRGACILLVVLWHVGTKHHARLPEVAPAVAGAWQWANLVVQPVRVPLFFLVSGHLAASAVRRPWPELLRTRVWRDWWLHAVWVVLAAAFFAVGPPLVTRTARSAGELALALAVDFTSTWYLYALALYAVLARACLRLPLGPVLAAAGVLAVLADTRVAPATGNLPGLMSNLLFFLAPALRPDLVDRLAARADGRTVALALGAYLPLAAVAVTLEVSRLAVVSTALSLVGVVAGLLLAVRVCRRPNPLAAGAAWLGRRTLPVYVLHLPLLALLAAALPPLPAPVTVVWPVLAVALLTAGSLLLHRLLLAAGLELLFRPPARVPVLSRS